MVALNWTALYVVPAKMAISYRLILTNGFMLIVSKALFFSAWIEPCNWDKFCTIDLYQAVPLHKNIP